MPTYKLLLKVTFENIETLEIASPDWLHFKVECCNCRTVSEKAIAVSTTETVEVVRSNVNLSYRCPECKRTHSLNIEKLYPVSHEHSEKWAPIASLECRGIQPVEPTLFGTDFIARPFNDAPIFRDVSLDEEWSEYDAKNDCAVSLLEPEVKFE